LSCFVISLTVWLQYMSRGFVPYDYVRGLIVHRSALLIFVIGSYLRCFNRT
jgi:hypothetical protein